MIQMSHRLCNPGTSATRPVVAAQRGFTAKGLPKGVYHRIPQCARMRQTQIAASATSQREQIIRDKDYAQAGLRLKGMVQNLGDGDEEMLEAIVAEESPYGKLQTQIVLAAVVTTVSACVASAAGKDPWGGASFSVDSLAAAAVGLGIAAPLVALRAWSWTPHASQVLPQLPDMRQAQLDGIQAWFRNLESWHVSTMVALEVLPLTLLLLPATQGALLGGLDLVSRWSSGYELGDDLPKVLSIQPLVQFACLSLTASIAALGKGIELSVTEAEDTLVSAAVENSDRYYRVMVTGVDRRAEDAQHAAKAFRLVAQAWLEMRAEACLAAASICALDIMVLGGIWYGTHNLAAPLVAALAINAVDYHKMHSLVMQKEHRAAAALKSGKGSSSSSSGSSSAAQSPTKK